MARITTSIIALAASAGLACGTVLAADDAVERVTRNGVELQLFLPSGVKAFRGVLVRTTTERLDPRDLWSETARALEFAHGILTVDRRRAHDPASVRADLERALERVSETSGHQELVHVPLAGVGHSEGGLIASVLLADPERVLTICVSRGWVLDSKSLEAEAQEVPILFALGALPDGFRMLPDVDGRFVPARRLGCPWALGLEWATSREFGNTAALVVPWIQAVATLRTPQAWNPLSDEADLEEIEESEGWLGENVPSSEHWALVSSSEDYRGEKARTSWLPDRATASVWRAFVSRDPPIQVTAAAGMGTSGGGAVLGQRPAGGDRTLLALEGQEIALGTEIETGAEPLQIEYYDRGERLGTAEASPWTWTWKKPGRGIHAVHAVWRTRLGERGNTNPVLIIVRTREAVPSGPDGGPPEPSASASTPTR